MIRKIFLKNYMSYKEQEIEFPRTGLFLIKGVNKDLKSEMESSIEVGKTNLLESILFGLFGKTARNLTKADYVRWGADSLCVEIYFWNGMKVIRTLDSVVFEADGKRYEDKLTSVQNQINAKLCCNYNSFFFATYFGYGYTSIVDLSPSERLKVFTSLFVLDLLDKCSNKAKQKVSQLDSRLQKIEYEIAETTGQIKELSVSYEDKKEEFEMERKRKRNQLLKQKDELQEKINKAYSLMKEKEKQLKELKDQIGIHEEYRVLRERRETLSAKIREFEAKRESLVVKVHSCEAEVERLKKDLETFKDGFCPLCKSPVPEDSELIRSLKKSLSSAISNLRNYSNELEKVEEDLIRLRAEFDSVSRKIDRLVDYKSQIDQLQGRIDQFKVLIQSWKEELENLKEELVKVEQAENPYELLEKERLSKLRKAQVKLSKLSSKRDEVSAERETYSFWTTGFRQVKMLMLNDLLRSYEKQFDMFLNLFTSGNAGVKVNFTDTGIDFIFLYKGREVRFDSYSSGMKQLLRLSSAFALQNLLHARTGVPLTLLILDEPCVNLSYRERHRVVDYLMQLKDTRQIFLVDHAIDVQERQFDKVLIVEKENGISKAFWQEE